eukprot:CAMPEP_0118875262 /NCGR_PEP_ID=MMETSP1163-20130328/16390_1 /TAXON_ID=124430 /ORGANISM="Phaeomonas parva, Strain CCMP2877" /LENGTH=319 /DNA_ID=CAMNT_0006810737 /DNA_START=177 /DNA_END=1133 /DNA_ORIENTATION=-
MASGDGDFHVRAQVTEKGGEISASVEETNRVRALLGLKPLRTGKEKSKDEIAVENFKRVKEEEAAKKRAQEARERVEAARRRRERNAKIEGPTLGDGDDGVSSVAWVQRSRAKAKEQEARKKEALERAAKGEVGADYTSSDLVGMEVSHDVNSFEEGREVILTLKDTDVLARDEHGNLAGLNEDGDELENVHMAEASREDAKKRRKKRLAAGAYTGWDDDEFEEDAIALGAPKKKKLLRQYDQDDEEAERAKAKTVIGSAGVAAKAKPKAEGAEGDGALPLSLQVERKAASEYYTAEEMAAFKKPKKAKKEKKDKKKRK